MTYGTESQATSHAEFLALRAAQWQAAYVVARRARNELIVPVLAMVLSAAIIGYMLGAYL